jgi:hypothetical protein
MPDRAHAQIFFTTMFAITIIEITVPSQINGTDPIYSARQRIGYAVCHAFAWTALALGLNKLFWQLLCGGTA